MNRRGKELRYQARAGVRSLAVLILEHGKMHICCILGDSMYKELWGRGGMNGMLPVAGYYVGEIVGSYLYLGSSIRSHK